MYKARESGRPHDGVDSLRGSCFGGAAPTRLRRVRMLPGHLVGSPASELWAAGVKMDLGLDSVVCWKGSLGDGMRTGGGGRGMGGGGVQMQVEQKTDESCTFFFSPVPPRVSVVVSGMEDRREDAWVGGMQGTRASGGPANPRPRSPPPGPPRTPAPVA